MTTVLARTTGAAGAGLAAGAAGARATAAAGADVNALVKRGDEGTIRVSLAPSPVAAPVRAGQQVGWVVVSQNGKQINKVPAVAAASVEKQPWWKKFWPF